MTRVIVASFLPYFLLANRRDHLFTPKRTPKRTIPLQSTTHRTPGLFGERSIISDLKYKEALLLSIYLQDVNTLVFGVFAKAAVNVIGGRLNFQAVLVLYF